jgi:hypothetical protein
LLFIPTTINPNQFAAGVDYDPGLTGSWTFDLFNGSDTLTVASPSPGSVGTVGLATDLMMTANGTTPTFSWTNPIGADVIKVSIYDLESRQSDTGLADRIFIQTIPNNGNSFIIPAGVLEDDHLYSVSIQADVVYTSGTNPSGSSQAGAAASQSQAFFDFSTGDFPVGADVFLPSTDTTGGVPIFNFNNPVVAGTVSYYDPLVAIGYDYKTGTGDPNFASVILPNIGDGLFELLLHNGTDFVLAAILAANVEYFFEPGGVDMFRILGIEVSAGLDPANAQAFVTGLSFVSDGRFTGTMTPIVAPVPLPAALPLFASTMIGLGFFGWRRKRMAQVA